MARRVVGLGGPAALASRSVAAAAALLCGLPIASCALSDNGTGPGTPYAGMDGSPANSGADVLADGPDAAAEAEPDTGTDATLGTAAADALADAPEAAPDAQPDAGMDGSPGSATADATTDGPGGMVEDAAADSEEEASLAPLTASIPAGTWFNDLQVALIEATPGATVCFTLDGSLPTCTAGVCQGNAHTYDNSSPVNIDGAVTNAATGTVTLNALACEAGSADVILAPQTYTLEVDLLSVNGPAQGTVAYATSGYTPTASSGTADVTFILSTDPNSPPTCIQGTSLGTSGTFSLDAGGGPQSFLVIGCKAGYVPSQVTTATYDVQLNPPSFAPPGGTTLNANTSVAAVDSANAGSGDWVCATIDGSTPVCTATGCMIGAGHSAPLHGGDDLLQVNTTGTTLSEIACAPAPTSGPPALLNSTVATSTYTLQLDPFAFDPPSGTQIPSVPGFLDVTISQDNPGGDEPYDFICYTKDGVTTPDCTCTSGGQTRVTGTSTNPVRVFSNASPVTVQAAGCLDTSNPDTYLPAVASASYP